jgi:ACS family hexuronate transporter-like MFS transporter
MICALLFAATTINYVDRQILSLLKPVLDQELGWTNEEFGRVNSAFQAAYAIGLLFFGAFIDRVGTKLGYAVSIAAWSFAAIGHAFVSSIRGFYLARVALGLGEGGNFPSAIKAIALWFPKKDRAFATSVMNAGTNVGAILAPAVVPWMAVTWGWQSAFVVAGIAGLLWLLLWWPLYSVPEGSKRLSQEEFAYIRSDVDEAGPEGNKVRWRTLFRYRQAWAFFVAKFLTDPVWWFFLIWLPDYFKKTRGLDIKSSAVHLVTIYSIVTVLSIGGGWLTGYLNQRGQSVTAARKTGMLLFAFTVLPIFFATRASNWAAVVLIGIAGASHQAFSATIYTTVSDMFPKKAVASVIGVGGMAGSVGGMLFPIFAGKLLDRFSAQGNISGGYTVLFAICGSAYLVAFGLNHLLAPSFAKVKWQES